MSIEFDDSEIGRLVADLGNAGQRAVERTRLVVSKNGHDVVSTAQQHVPVDTGFLKSSISVDFDADRLGYEAGPTALYGGYVELGTTRMAPQPYLFPAFDQHLPTAISALEQVAAGILRP